MPIIGPNCYGYINALDGAMVLNLIEATQVTTAATAMPCDRFLLAQMITGTLCELLIGVVLDEAHGYVLTIGAGRHQR